MAAPITRTEQDGVLDRLARRATRFLGEVEGLVVETAVVRAWLDRAVADGFEVTEDLLRYAVMRARCPTSLPGSVMDRRNADPAVRLLHMQNHHAELWGQMVGDLNS